MNVALCSIFRDSEHYLDRYFDQIDSLERILGLHGHQLRLILAEGDSSDHTFHNLEEQVAFYYSAALLQCHHGGPKFGSVNDDTRWRQSSYVWSKVWEELKPEDDVVVYLESDLIWDAMSLFGLIVIAHENPEHANDAVAPMVWLREPPTFYDTWGFRRKGVCFSPDPPYHSDLVRSGLFEIESAGSCIVFRGEVARAAKFDPPELAVVGLCQNMRSKGYRLWLDPMVSIIHP